MRALAPIFAVACSACAAAEDLNYAASAAATVAATAACEGRVVPGRAVFVNEAYICIADASPNRMRPVDVVLGEPQSHPSLRQRIVLEQLSGMNQSEDISWGLASSGELTFFSRESFIDVGASKIAIAEGFGGCVPVDQIDLAQRATSTPQRCELRLILREVPG